MSVDTAGPSNLGGALLVTGSDDDSSDFICISLPGSPALSSDYEYMASDDFNLYDPECVC